MGFNTNSSFPYQKNAPILFSGDTQCLRGICICVVYILKLLLRRVTTGSWKVEITCRWREASTHNLSTLLKSPDWPVRQISAPYSIAMLYLLILHDFMPLLWVLPIHWYAGETAGLSSLGMLSFWETQCLLGSQWPFTGRDGTPGYSTTACLLQYSEATCRYP